MYDKDKVVVYSGTPNTYGQIAIAMYSLLCHTKVDKIYVLTDGTPFPYRVPDFVEFIDVSGQTYFPKNSINYNNPWSYMILLRLAYTKLFPQYDRILSLDIDTIVDYDISDMWDFPLENYYLAAAHERHKSTPERLYFNMGVAMFNLKKLREDHKDDELIKACLTKRYAFCEQDCINELCEGMIFDMPSDYNVTLFNEVPTNIKIVHFAAIKDYRNEPLFQFYVNLMRERRAQ